LPSLIRTPLSGQCCKEYAGPQRRIETDKFLGVSAVAFDVAAVRKRFGALQRDDLVFFDGPGGSQVPDEVIDAIASYLR
jgi:hypothetical protein